MPEKLSQSDFDHLFQKHEKALRLYARSMLPSWDGVDEVIQTASIVMWRKMDQVDDADGFRAWGKCVVRFEAQKYCRSRARDCHVFDTDLLDLLGSHQDEEDEPNMDLELKALRQCMDSIGEASRKLVLAPYRGHGVLTQLAAASGRTRNSLYKQIRRIRSKLETCVNDQMSGVPKR